MTAWWVLALSVAALLLWWLWHAAPKEPELAYEALPLQTDAEKRFYDLLTQVVPAESVMLQVQLSRVVAANPKAVGSKEANRQRLRICQMSLDYLLIDLDATTPLIAVELDDWSHQRPDRVVADEKKDQALSTAGVAVLRFHGESMPTPQVLEKALIQALKRTLAARPDVHLNSKGWAQQLLS